MSAVAADLGPRVRGRTGIRRADQGPRPPAEPQYSGVCRRDDGATARLIVARPGSLRRDYGDGLALPGFLVAFGTAWCGLLATLPRRGPMAVLDDLGLLVGGLILAGGVTLGGHVWRLARARASFRVGGGVVRIRTWRPMDGGHRRHAVPVEDVRGVGVVKTGNSFGSGYAVRFELADGRRPEFLEGRPRPALHVVAGRLNAAISAAKRELAAVEPEAAERGRPPTLDYARRPVAAPLAAEREGDALTLRATPLWARPWFPLAIALVGGAALLIASFSARLAWSGMWIALFPLLPFAAGVLLWLTRFRRAAERRRAGLLIRAALGRPWVRVGGGRVTLGDGLGRRVTVASAEVARVAVVRLPLYDHDPSKPVGRRTKHVPALRLLASDGRVLATAPSLDRRSLAALAAAARGRLRGESLGFPRRS